MKGFLSDLAIWGMLQGYVQIILEGILRMVLRNDGSTIDKKSKKVGFSFSMRKTEQWCYFFHHK
jgi:hypothetical protein